MKYTDLELQRINAARLRPVELSPSEFEYEKKIGRYKPSEYTFMKFNPGDQLDPVEKFQGRQGSGRILRKEVLPSVDQLDIFAVENTYDKRIVNLAQD